MNPSPVYFEIEGALLKRMLKRLAPVAKQSQKFIVAHGHLRVTAFDRHRLDLLVAVCRDDAARRCWWEAYVDARHGGAAHGLEGLASVPSEEIT